MHTAIKAVVVLGLTGAFAAPAMAADDVIEMHPSTITCAEFLAMGHEDRMDAAKGLRMAATDEEEVQAESKDETMAEDHMPSDETASADVSELVGACQGNPDMKAMEALVTAEE